MTKTYGKRFNAQRAARHELRNPQAQEGIDFVTAKNADGTWSIAPKAAPKAKTPKPREQSPAALPNRTASKPAELPKGAPAAIGKRRAIEETAACGVLPEPPNFSADTHKPYRGKLADLIALVAKRDVAGLRAYPIKTYSSSPKALDRFRNLAVTALTAKPGAAGKEAPEAANAKIIADAKEFKATKFKGRGKYDTRRGFTDVDAAIRCAVEELGRGAMVYAINARGNQALIGGVKKSGFERTSASA